MYIFYICTSIYKWEGIKEDSNRLNKNLFQVLLSFSCSNQLTTHSTKPPQQQQPPNSRELKSGLQPENHRVEFSFGIFDSRNTVTFTVWYILYTFIFSCYSDLSPRLRFLNDGRKMRFKPKMQIQRAERFQSSNWFICLYFEFAECNIRMFHHQWHGFSTERPHPVQIHTLVFRFFDQWSKVFERHRLDESDYKPIYCIIAQNHESMSNFKSIGHFGGENVHRMVTNCLSNQTIHKTKEASRTFHNSSKWTD